MKYIEKEKIVNVLRLRGLDDRADWVDRTLPALVDTGKNSGLLSTLDIDPDAIPAAEVEPQLD